MFRSALLLLALLCRLSCSAAEAAAASILDLETDLTLDEEAYASIRREMQSRGQGVSAETQAWRTAMSADSDEGVAARLLPLLMRLNPALPAEKYPELYTAALQLHVRARRGDAAAVTELAASLRCGAWKALALPTDAESAAQGEEKGTF